MITHIRVGGRLPLKALALFVGVSVLSRGSAMADDNDPVVTNQVQTNPEPYTGPQSLHLFHGPESFGTLGYGPPGLQPGAQGFSLGYHPGYGYGRGALGVGAEGGYPFYGGPGYPHPWPCLRRIGGIVPFPYYGGPGYPIPGHPNYFGEFGPLSPDQPVVTVATDPGGPVYATDYGPFTGSAPNAEALFAPFVARAAAGVSSMRVRPPSPTAPPTPAPPPPPRPPLPLRAADLAPHSPQPRGPREKSPDCPLHVNSSGSKRNRSSTPAACGA